MFLGIEIGGTKLQLGLGRGDGKLILVEDQPVLRRTVNAADGAAGIRRQIEGAIPELLARTGVDRSTILGVGIGFGGPFDDATQRTIKSHQIDGWDDFPLRDWAEGLLGVSAAIGNDADVGGLGEARFGAGQRVSPLFYITVGTGIGGGLILGGEIYRAVGRGAAEIGHLKVLDWSRAGTPMMVALEQIAAGPAIGLRARELAENGEAAGSLLVEYVEGDFSKLTGELVGRAAKRKDAFALRVLREAVDALAEAISQTITLLCPQRVVIGGGVSLLGEELFFEPIRQGVADRVFPPFAGLTDIVPAALGEEVVIHGAVALASKAAAR
ncbi:ROK family protein [Limnoglobus roseus]|uniref:ROK family protein n=1 Tax=Limnoglobus roseus TaxID=2598579 RepID=A0A5C1ANR5_9BACT|nr:ROK family protein [Limnoglobus roseus]QEL19392.1 ROK family protein [Limnoglobus roseus]